MGAQNSDKKISYEDAIAAHRACCPYHTANTFSEDSFTARLNKCGAGESLCANQCYYIKHFIETLDLLCRAD